MTATDTHDAKRGEDVRARINVLSEIPKQWEERVKAWRAMNRGKKRKVDMRAVPDVNDEYFFYQTLIGAYPFALTDHSQFVQRIEDYTIKAIREAKVHTGWLKPDSNYEEAFLTFINRVLEQSPENKFLQDFLTFQRKIAHFGMLNSLSQTMLKITSPGVPDFYQGTELWALNLVDPDNRRPVDFYKRRRHLNQARQQQASRDYLDKIKASPEDGRIKLFLTHRALMVRRANLRVFEKGSYLPLEVRGPLQNHVISFARQETSAWAITIVPRFFTALVEVGEYPLGLGLWQETRVVLPEKSPQHWTEEITAFALNSSEGSIQIGEVLTNFPVALLTGIG